MKETAFICNNASSGSLILLDELGRATSNEDGVAIAWSVAESLLSKRAMTFFVSHYPQMCQMSRIYPAVQNQHLKATASEEGDGSILYSHKVANGPCKVTSNYGIEMAKSCGWPADLVAKVRHLSMCCRFLGDLVNLCPHIIMLFLCSLYLITSIALLSFSDPIIGVW